MIESRINDPDRVSAHEVQAILDEGFSPTVQFSAPGYTPALLRQVNELCGGFGSRLEVRFYGHYGVGFDAAALQHLPDVAWLSVDCIERIRNEEFLFRLAKLDRLSFGVHHFDNSSFLIGLPLERIQTLSLSETAKRNLDLAPLSRCRRVKELFVHGHTKNISVIAALPELTSVRLSGMPHTLELSFLNDAIALRSLKLLLGSRKSFDELRHARLESLEVVRVRGLESLGPLARFPALRVLRIEDQARLRSISVTGPHLHKLSVFNCIALEAIEDLDCQPELTEFRTGRTQLNLESMLAHEWPPSVRVVALYSRSAKWNAKARSILEARGYGEFTAFPLHS